MDDSGSYDRVVREVCAAIARIRNIDVEHPPLASHLSEDFGVTSLDMIEIVLDVEDALGVRVALDAASRSRTVGELVDVFSGAVAGGAGPGATAGGPRDHGASETSAG